MSAERNKAILRQLTDAVNSGDMSVVNELVAENYVLHTSGGQEIGIEGYKQYLERIRNIYPDFHLTIEDMIAEGDKVAHRFTWRGRHRGGFQGIDPAGKPVTVKAIAVSRFADDKIAEEWTIHDRLGLYQQLEVVPPTEELGR